MHVTKRRGLVSRPSAPWFVSKLAYLILASVASTYVVHNTSGTWHVVRVEWNNVHAARIGIPTLQ